MAEEEPELDAGAVSERAAEPDAVPVALPVALAAPDAVPAAEGVAVALADALSEQPVPGKMPTTSTVEESTRYEGEALALGDETGLEVA